MSDPEQLLGDALQQRASGTTYTPTPIADVVSTARGVRRQQRHRAALVAAAVVLAVVTPTAVVLSQSGERSPQPSGIPSATDSVTPDDRLASLPRGPAPQVDYLDGSTYVASAGGRTRLPGQATAIGVTPYHGGFLVTSVVDFGTPSTWSSTTTRARSWASGRRPAHRWSARTAWRPLGSPCRDRRPTLESSIADSPAG